MATVTSEPVTLAPSPDADPDRLYEVIDGQVVEIDHMGAWENWIATILSTRLNNWAEPHRTGSAAVEMLFLLDPLKNLRRRPDVAFVSRNRWGFHRPIPRGENAWAVVPDLAVEVISPTNLADEVVDKVETYFQAGVRLVWIIYPTQNLVYAYDSPRSVAILGTGDHLDGGECLPGFRLSVETLFGNDTTTGLGG